MKFLLSILMLLLGLSVSGTVGSVHATSPLIAQCSDDSVGIRGDWGKMRFRVDVADDDAERGKGLMFVRDMDRDKGMLFVWDTPRRAQFWMRNTYIPLDMIFVGEDGLVTHIHHNAVPLDETAIDGGEGVIAVLEINGGLSRSFGIDVGSQLQHPAFGPAAAWSCNSV
jgi:uncharacterized membrane protein (UPF0127 family)